MVRHNLRKKFLQVVCFWNGVTLKGISVKEIKLSPIVVCIKQNLNNSPQENTEFVLMGSELENQLSTVVWTAKLFTEDTVTLLLLNRETPVLFLVHPLFVCLSSQRVFLV